MNTVFVGTFQLSSINVGGLLHFRAEAADGSCIIGSAPISFPFMAPDDFVGTIVIGTPGAHAFSGAASVIGLNGTIMTLESDDKQSVATLDFGNYPDLVDFLFGNLRLGVGSLTIDALSGCSSPPPRDPLYWLLPIDLPDFPDNPFTPRWLGSPLVIDMDGDGVETIARANSNAFFDLNLDGLSERVGWVGVDDALLAHDINGNGRIDEKSEATGVGLPAPARISPPCAMVRG